MEKNKITFEFIESEHKRICKENEAIQEEINKLYDKISSNDDYESKLRDSYIKFLPEKISVEVGDAFIRKDHEDWHMDIFQIYKITKKISNTRFKCIRYRFRSDDGDLSFYASPYQFTIDEIDPERTDFRKITKEEFEKEILKGLNLEYKEE